ncbi:hypothetical protein AMP2_gp003 [Pseudomonas phage vB_Pae_AM.P2]|uniref:Uncharacterized protein n=1 Tax=Pseudomonas phage vB_Pae_AM.P2 TaxID=2731695 RepID=A0A7S5W983_9CAUD|nr:hypothetical protein AMP2_gp003 [Pseudomonas phage vB_Pae_AM.P2]
MPAGFQVYSLNGNVLMATSDYSNMAYQRTVRLLSRDFAYIHNIDVVGEYPVIVLKQSYRPGGGSFRVAEVNRQKINATTWRIGLCTEWYPSNAAWADIMIFGSAADMSINQNSGVQVFKADGKLAFSDRLPYLRVHSTHQVPDYGKGAHGFTVPPNCGIMVTTTSRMGKRGIAGHGGEPGEVFALSEGISLLAGGQGSIAMQSIGVTNEMSTSNWESVYGGGPPMLVFVDLSKLVYS